ncbi:hypothetical protein EJB05_36998, partial [Eragrostis curvula]
MAAAGSTPVKSAGPVPFKDVDDGSVPEHTPKEELSDLVAGLPCGRRGGTRLYQRFWLPAHLVPGAVVFQRRFTPRPDDVILASPAKCGTTWLKALAFAVAARTQYPPAGAEHPLRRLNPHDCVPFIEEVFARGVEAKLDLLPSPRLMNTHLPYTLLPEAVTSGGGCGRVVYICRDLKDMVVSMWHFFGPTRNLSFDEVFQGVCEGTMPVGPVWDHVLGYWRASVARPDRVLFLKYEDLLRDPGSNVRRLAEFMGQPFSAAEEAAGAVASVVDLCCFRTMKGLEANKTGTVGSFIGFPRGSYFRKGVAGDWASHMTPEMAARLDGIVRDKFRGTGLNFT